MEVVEGGGKAISCILSYLILINSLSLSLHSFFLKKVKGPVSLTFLYFCDNRTVVELSKKFQGQAPPYTPSPFMVMCQYREKKLQIV